MPPPQLGSHALTRNIPLWSPSGSGPMYWENTCVAAEPSSAHPRGVIALLPGQAGNYYLQKIITRPIYDAGGNFEFDESASILVDMPRSDDPAGDPYLGGHTDNKIVRNRHGDFLAMKNTACWKPVVNPKPWQNVETYDARGPVTAVGMRGVHAIWRGHSPFLGPIGFGPLQWTVQGLADPFVFNGGSYGFPSALDDDGKKLDLAHIGEQTDNPIKWANPGADRPEMYACPFTGYLYITARWEGGAYAEPDKTPITKDFFQQLFLLLSTDQGKSWTVIKDDLGTAEPLAMTSTPNGRLFLHQWTGSGSRLFCSNLFDANANATPKIFPIQGSFSAVTGDAQNGTSIDASDGVIAYTETVNGKKLAYGPDPTFTKADSSGKPIQVVCERMGHPSLSRISTGESTSEVRFSYLLLNEHGRQSDVILSLGVVDDQFGVPQIDYVSRVGRVDATNSKTHSVINSSFIDPDYVSMPPGHASNTALFYWIEVNELGTDTCARYCLVDGAANMSPSAALSISAPFGLRRTWDTTEIWSNPGGDYVAGGFYFWNGLNFVAQWWEPTGIRANIIHVPIPLKVDVSDIVLERAIDPLALLLPSDVYGKLVEKLGPHNPKVSEVREAAKNLTAERRAEIATTAQEVRAYADLVAKALAPRS
jgi:hypothetical protein